MGADLTRSTYRGLVVPDERVKHANLNASLSSYTEASPKPGVPVGGTSPRSAMVLQATGEQAGGTTLNVRAARGGFPGPSSRSGGFVYKLATDTYYLGWDLPNAISGWEWITLSTSSAGAQQPHIIRMANGHGLSCERRDSAVPAQDGITIRKFDADAGTWSALATVTSDDWESTSPTELFPCFVELPSGRIHVYYWVNDTGTDTAQVQMQYTDDDGATWSLGSSNCLDTAIDTSTYTLGRLRGAYSGGQVCLVASVTDSVAELVQWGSDDGGASFVTVMSSNVADMDVPEVLPNAAGGFTVFNINTDTDRPVFRPISNAFHDLSTVTATTIATPDGVTADLAVWAGEDGAWFVTAFIDSLTLVHPAAQVIWKSTDEGSNWTRLDAGTGSSVTESIWNAGDEATYLTDYSAAEIRGRTVMLTRVVTPSTTYDAASLLVLYLGGYSDLTMPAVATFASDSKQMAWERTWLPFEAPDQILNTWVKTTSGSPSISFATSGMLITADGSSYAHYGLDSSQYPLAPHAPNAVDKELVIGFMGQLVTGGDHLNRAAGFLVRQADGTDDYEVTINCYDSSSGPGASAGYRVTDINSGAAGTDVTFDVTQPFELRIVMLNGTIRIWHRAIGAHGALQRRTWVNSYNNVSLTSDTSTPESFGEVDFGGDQTGTHSMYFRGAFWTDLAQGFVGHSAGFTTPDDLYPRPFSARPVSLHQGTRVAAVDGPAIQGETWNIPARALYGVELIDPAISPSPRQRWRTVAETEQTLVWDLGDSDDTELLGPGPFALVVLGANWRTATLYGVPASGSDTTLMSIDMAAGLTGLTYIRNGKVIRPGVTTADAAHWIHHAELEGATVDLGSGDLVKVTKNSQGWWTDAANVETPKLYAPGIDDTEGTGGTCNIWMPAAVFFLRTPPSPAEWLRLKLVIDAQSTADDYLETGGILYGPAYLFGRDYSWGRIVSTEANASVTTRRGGTRFSRRHGPARRMAELSWTDGLDTTPIYASTPDPNFIKAGTTSPGVVGTPAATASLLEGILLEQDGPHRLVTYLPSVDGESDSVVTLNRRPEMLYGRLGDSVRREAIQGDEVSTEMQRLGGVRITEEV